jgi:alpha-beta hydrolase superfamily lysophospholipase
VQVKHSAVEIPPLLPGRIVHLPSRGEMFVRHHQHANPDAPTVLLLHGWTGSSDLQFFTAYEELAKDYSIVGVDHRGHGRGLRPHTPFALEDCADDAADYCWLFHGRPHQFVVVATPQ